MLEKAKSLLQREWSRAEKVWGRDVVLAYFIAALVFFPLKWTFGPGVGYAYGILWIVGILVVRYWTQRDA